MVAGVRAAAPQIGPDQLRAAMAQAQSRVRAAGAELGELTGCTFTGLVVVPPADGPDDTGRVPASGDGPTEAGYPGGSGATDQVLRVRRTAPVARTAPGTAAAGSAPGTAPAGSAPGTAAAGSAPGTAAAGSAPGTAAAGSGSTTELAGWIVQIGDSRAYRLRDGLLELLTVDHTAAWLGAVYGWYPADSPAAAAARYQLTRYVGHPAMPEPDLLNVSLRPGDVYCLCTDGVAEQLDYQRLSGRLGAAGNLLETVRSVLADTLVAGGRDNATIAVLRVEP
jgi:hypothetical protein